MTSTNLAAICVAIGALLAGQAQAKDLYVSPTGDDKVTYANNSATQPWSSITKAGLEALAGDTVNIGAGTYIQSLKVAHSGTSGARITFKSWSGKLDVIIKKNTVYIPGKDYITIKGLMVQDVYIPDANVQGIDTVGIAVEGPSKGVIISGNVIMNTTGSGISAWGTSNAGRTATYDYKGIHNLVVESNVLINTVVNGWNEAITMANGVDTFFIRYNTLMRSKSIVSVQGGGEAIDVKEGASNGYIAYNTITQYNKTGIYLDGGGLTNTNGTLQFAASNPPKLKNINIYANKIYKNDFDLTNAIMLASEGHGSMDGVNIYNNLIYNNGGSGVTVYAHESMAPDASVANVNITNNSFYNNGWVPGQTGNYHADIDIDTYKLSASVAAARFKNISIRNNAQFKSVGDVRRGIWVAYPELGNGYVTVSNNSDTTAQDNSSAAVNPFNNPDASDFTLKAGSAAIDRGAPVGTVGVPRTDITGALRPKGNGVDIGAYEGF